VTRLLALLSLSLSALTLSCASASEPGTDATRSDPFIAFSEDFYGFRNWDSFPVPFGLAQGDVHLRGARTEYLNRRPPPGSTTFPVGTMIVKETDDDSSYEFRRVFAMVKRGGGYNADGALGWEWFELQNNADGSVKQILWRGFGPPMGTTYGGNPTACTSCHAGSESNDYVQSNALQLTALAPAGR
jgi:hypothetical protein